MDNRQKAFSFRHLVTICKDHSSLSTKIASITFINKPSIHWFELVIILLEYFQLLSLIFLLSSNFASYSEYDKNLLVKAITLFTNLLNPGTWLQFKTRPGITIAILAISAVHSLLKYGLFIYITIRALWNIKGKPWVLNMWTKLFKIQDRVLFFNSISIWANAASAAFEYESENLRARKTVILAISGIFIITELMFSIFLQVRLCYILPSKSLLSSKDNKIRIITLIQKILIQATLVILTHNSLAIEWISVSINFVLSSIRLVHHFNTLPNFYLKALKFKGILLSLVSSLNFALIAQTIAKSADYPTDLTFLLIIWVPSSILASKISCSYLDKAILNLMTTKKETSLELQVQKIFIAKELRRLKSSSSGAVNKHKYSYFMDITVNNSLKDIFNLGSTTETQELDLYSKKSANEIFLQHLENLAGKFPNSSLIMLHIAYFLAKKLHYYSRALRVITGIKSTHPYKYGLNASLLILDMQESIKTKYKNKDTNIDLSTYIKSTAHFAQLKIEIIDQARLLTQLYQEVLDDHSDLEKIFTLSQAIHQHKTKIEKETKHFLGLIPDYFVTPLPLFAEYNLVLNFSLSKHALFYKKYLQKLKKYGKYFTQDKLAEENIYHDDTMLFICSFERASDAGKTIFCTKNTERLLGRGPEFYVGKTINMASMPSLRTLYSMVHKSVAESGDTSMSGTSIRTFAYHKDGYLVEVDFYVNIHPYLTQGFCQGVFVRPVPSNSKEYLWLYENGDIEGATKNFSERLGLYVDGLTVEEGKKINVKLISKDLSRLNEAFNIIGRNELDQKNGEAKPQVEQAEADGARMSYQEALELYNAYSVNQGDIIVRPLNNRYASSAAYVYRCNIVNSFIGPIFLKLVILDDASSHDAEDSRDDDNDNQVKDMRQKPLENNKDSHNSEDFDFVDENDLAETNPRNIEATQAQTPLSPYRNVQERWVLDLQSAEAPVTTERQLVSPKDNQRFVREPISNRNKESSALRRNLSYECIDNKKNEIYQRDYSMSIGSKDGRMSLALQEKRICTALEAALKINYYPNRLILYSVFYLVMMSVFAGLLTFEFKLDGTIQSLIVIKDLVNNAEYKEAYMATAQLMAILLLGIDKGNFKIGILPNPAEYYITILKENLLSVSSFNTKLLLSMSNFQNEYHSQLFSKDVGIFDNYYDDPTQVFTLLNSFQATDRLVEVGLKGVAKMQKNITSARDEMRFLIRNTVNDLLVRNEAISDYFMGCLIPEKESLDLLVTYSLVAVIMLNLVKIVIFSVVIWRQYFEDKSLLLSLTKLNHQELKNVIERISSFVNAVENEKHIEKEKMLWRNTVRQQKISSKKESLTSPNYTKKQRRYTLYTVNLILFTIILMVSLTFIYISTCDSLWFFQSKQDQIYFIQRLRSHIILTGSMSQDLITDNGTTLNHNNPIYEQFSLEVKDLASMRSMIPSIFMDNIDLRIHSVLYNDGCLLLEGSVKHYCQTQNSEFAKNNVISLLVELESLMTQRKKDFELSDKSHDSLSQLESKNFPRIFSTIILLDAQTQAIVSGLNLQYEKDLVNAEEEINTYFKIFYGYLVAYGFLIWVFFLRKFNKINNQLKRVLQNFPPTLVFSNCTIRVFLLRASKGILDYIKNDI